VGEDQLPHLELAREIARRVNFMHGGPIESVTNLPTRPVFPEPEPILSSVPKLAGLDGRKMSKSYDNAIYLGDTSAEVDAKAKTMVTDPARVRRTDPGDPNVCPVFSYHRLFSDEAMIAEIDRAKKDGDSVGGVVEVIARGVPAGLGSYAQWDRKLDGRIAQALMSIHAVKAVAIGAGFAGSETRGSAFHDEIVWDEAAGIRRPTNRAGGLEGGVTNGEEIRALAVVKPIPTLLIALRSVDLATREPRKASVERSDTCVVPAAGVVAEAMLALVLADALLEKTGGDSLDEVLAHLGSTRALQRRIAGPR
jgi:chorismate synthase